MKFKDPITGEYKTLHLKTGDTLPVGTIVSFEGDEIPEGYEEVIGEEARVVISPTEPTTGEEVWIDDVNKKIYTKNGNGDYEEFYNEDVILYNDKDGDNTSITLSDNVSNYKSLEIMYKAEDVYEYAKIFEPNDKKIALDINVSFASTNYYKISKWEIKNNQINFLTGNAYSIGTDGVSGIFENNKQVHIVKVVGYK